MSKTKLDDNNVSIAAFLYEANNARLMCMTQSSICDYSDYDYKSEFWANQNRDYEHQLEESVVKTLLKKNASQCRSICDAGCGFGRLFNSYKN